MADGDSVAMMMMMMLRNYTYTTSVVDQLMAFTCFTTTGCEVPDQVLYIVRHLSTASSDDHHHRVVICLVVVIVIVLYKLYKSR